MLLVQALHPRVNAQRLRRRAHTDRVMDHGEHGAHEAHDKHAGHSVAMFRDRFWLSLVLTIPVVLLSTDVQEWLGYSLPDIPGIAFVPAILGPVVFFSGGL